MSGKTARPTADDETLTWVSEDQLQRNEALPLAGCDRDISVADDVRALALAALRSERELTGA